MSKRTIRIGWRSAALVAWVALAHLWCAEQPAPLVRSTSRLVLLDVVVTDKAGRPIRDLEQDDFTVFENGVPQKISLRQGLRGFVSWFLIRMQIGLAVASMLFGRAGRCEDYRNG